MVDVAIFTVVSTVIVDFAAVVDNPPPLTTKPCQFQYLNRGVFKADSILLAHRIKSDTKANAILHCQC